MVVAVLLSCLMITLSYVSHHIRVVFHSLINQNWFQLYLFWNTWYTVSNICVELTQNISSLNMCICFLFSPASMWTRLSSCTGFLTVCGAPSHINCEKRRNMCKARRPDETSYLWSSVHLCTSFYSEYILFCCVCTQQVGPKLTLHHGRKKRFQIPAHI